MSIPLLNNSAESMPLFLCRLVPFPKLRKNLRTKIRQTLWLKFFYKLFTKNGFSIQNNVVTTCDGVQIDIFLHPKAACWTINEIFIDKVYDLKLTSEAILIDIGFNRGIASLFFAKYPNITRIYAFEPFKTTYEMAQANLKLNPELCKKILAYNYGLGRSDTVLELSYNSAQSEKMSTTQEICQGKYRQTEKVVIKDAAIQLLKILSDNPGKKLILKCDCEGAEFEIFARLNDADLLKKIDGVLMEYHYNDPEILISILTNNGFAVHTMTYSEKNNLGFVYAVRYTSCYQ